MNQEPLTWELLSKRPVFGTISAGLIVVMGLYIFGILKEVPCGNGTIETLNRTFIHLDTVHILSNLFVFYVLSRIEVIHGSSFFATLIVQLLAITTIFEILLKQFINAPCSVGFSGILFGLVVWELLYDRNLSLVLLISVGAMVVTPSLQNPKASLTGHTIGALSGLVLALYYRPSSIKP